MKKMSVKSLVIVCLVAGLACTSLALAAANWSHSIIGTIAGNGLGFSVYRDSACTNLWDGSVATVVSDTSQPFTETYYIKNLSNGPLTVTGSVNAGTSSYAWADGKSSLSLAAGQVGSLALTVSNYNGGNVGSFSVAVTFNSN